jgi:hypothetical protein
MESARLWDFFARQCLKERTTLEQGPRGQAPFPNAPKHTLLGLTSLLVLKEPPATQLDQEGGLNPVCTNLSARSAKKTSRKDFSKTV